MLKLKTYQTNALEALTQFLQRSRSMSPQEAFRAALAEQERDDEPYHPLFGDMPCVCVRIPTGGGKTLLGAHAIGRAGKAVLDSDAPIALWLTPSDAIRTQTLDALSNARHPYRQALAEYFGENVQICDLDSLQTINPQDIGKNCIVVVSTIQSFNVTDTAKRNVYSFFEELQPHFASLPPHLAATLERVTESDVQNQPYLTSADVGRVKYSVANWLHLHRPIVIVDEAHNNRTDRFFKTLGRLNPSCIVEMTATPIPGNNVLYHVSAQELKAEDMIKLPIVLAEHPDGWQACLRDAILTRDKLERESQKELDYVRPIVLIQAAPKGNEATVEVVRQHLIGEEHIPEVQIAVATGSQKELDGVDLLDRASPVRYVITVEALKEGWDCPFAYVLASLQSVNSSKDVEQLLGRVLRMPYARARQQPDLNKAYAHIVAENFAQAASSLKDRMVQNMGFNRLETASLVVPQQSLPLVGGESNAGQSQLPAIPDCHIEVPQAPDTQHWPEEIKAAVEIRQTSQGATLLLKGDVDSETLKQVEAFITAPLSPKARVSVKEQFEEHRATQRALRAPAQLGLSFAPIPQLCLELDGYLEVVERETLSNLGEWSLLDSPVQLAGFAFHETVNSFEIDVNGQQVRYRHIDATQLKLNDVSSHVSENDLVRWLDREVRQADIGQLQLQAYLAKLLTHLIHDRQIPLTALVRARFPLAQAIDKEIERLRKVAMQKGFQGRLFDMTVPSTESLAHRSFQFEPGRYPARNWYRGSYDFNKHFYDQIHDLRETTSTGKRSEEFLCAQAIDAHRLVKLWVRNIERQEKHSFWLPTSTDYFYPDFVAELTDGRLFVVEYKGEPYKTNDDSREKKLVGEQWEKSSNGHCLFLFAVAEDECGRTVFQQIHDKLA
ncbi:DEAD/DEAH box helicase [Burkholderia pseudomallei]|uniref:DEAD/DEAH box helicase n=1 Tax=Burkholderia pseudomallei TaxID=28450 RepID=UPI0021F72747|nr:DEAD/DEAH box helicase family protein [Burkholderia pseudomallei]MCV9981733.1 DEAD/DEAH box helicase family protein [Burkholderia pseudomallei]MCV9986961.1 DEAD/DEAH box helicase family protein [Burkholderia pseudomallei]MCW0151124.1 DEAD/DEAH box helicase family protein [Burkholderia pseudomallei]